MAVLKNAGISGTNINAIEPGILQNPQSGKQLFPYLYFGEIRKVNDEDRMGRIWVYIKEIDGDRDSEQHWHRLNYCPPFAGGTPTNEIGSTNKFSNSQLSYGMWFPAPDIGNTVLCGFVNGDPNKGVWFGSAFKQMMNHMVPGIPATATPDGNFPATEYNKNPGVTTNVKGPIRPVYEPLTQGLKFQGLEKDSVRGFTTSGGQRQTTSRTYGFLTPRGTQITFDDGYKVDENTTIDETQKDYNPNIAQRGNDNPAKEWEVGSASQAASKPQSRRDECIRFRTRSGAQILVSESEGLIYIINRDGTSWIEMTQDGKIDVFANSSVSVHSYGSINLTAQEDVNIEAGRNMNIKARGSTTSHTDAGTGNIFIESSDATHLTTGGNYRLYVGANNEIMVQNRLNVRSDSFDQNVNEDYSLCVQNDQSITVGRDRRDNVKGDCDIHYEADNYVKVGQNQTVDIESEHHITVGTDFKFMNGNDVHWTVGKDTYEAWPMGGVIHYGHLKDYVVPPCIVPTAAVKTCAEAQPTPPAAPEPRTPTLPNNPEVAEKPIINTLNENKIYTASISNRVPEHEPWEGHKIIKTSSHAPYLGPNGSIDDVAAMAALPPAGSTAFAGLAPGGGVKGNTKPELSTIDYDKIKETVSVAVNNPAKAVSTAAAGQVMTNDVTDANTSICQPTVTDLVNNIATASITQVPELINGAIATVTPLINEQIPGVVDSAANKSVDITNTAQKTISGTKSDVVSATLSATTATFNSITNIAPKIISGEISVNDAINSIMSDLDKETSKEVTNVVRKVDNVTATLNGKLYIANFERYVPYEYPDGVDGNGAIRTVIGYGHQTYLDTKKQQSSLETGLTEEEAWALFEKDLKSLEKNLLKKFVITPAQNQFEAFLDFAFNRGLNNPDVNGAIKAFNEGELEKISGFMLNNSATLGGDLITRRQSNIKLFYEGIYGSLQTRPELKKSGLLDYTLVHWTGEHLWKPFPGFKHKEFPDEDITKRAIKQAWLSWNRSTEKDSFALPGNLPNNKLVERVGGIKQLKAEAKKSLFDQFLDLF